MKQIKKTGFLSLLFFSIIFQACQKRKIKNLEEEIYDDFSKGSYSYYQGGVILSPAGPSPHGDFKLKYNSVAATVLDSNGELPTGGTFPNGSILVKEVYSSGAINLYAVMKKDTESKFAANGWIWIEYSTDGKTVFSAKKKGDGCISCHSSGTARDQVKTYDLH